MPEERQFAQPLPTAVIAVLALAAECGITYACLWNGPAWWATLALHFGVSACLFLWCWSPRFSLDKRLPLLLATGTAALGPVGPAGTLLVMALARWYMRRAIPFEEWYQSLFPEMPPERAEFAEPYELEPVGDPASFADILAFGSFQQKQALIALINNQFRPAFGWILRRALADPNNSIRTQAATAMNKLENSILKRIFALERRLEEDSNDREAMRAIAQLYDDYLYSGLLEAGREDEVRRRTLAAWRQVIAADPGDAVSGMAMGRLLLRAKRYTEALDYLEGAFQAGLSLPQAALWYMECLFHLGRFDQLRQFVRSHEPRFFGVEGLPMEALETLRVWKEDALGLHEDEATLFLGDPGQPPLLEWAI